MVQHKTSLVFKLRFIFIVKVPISSTKSTLICKHVFYYSDVKFTNLRLCTFNTCLMLCGKKIDRCYDRGEEIHIVSQKHEPYTHIKPYKNESDCEINSLQLINLQVKSW